MNGDAMVTVRSIVGREAEVEVLRSFLGDPAGPALALLIGEAGVGKTSLLTAVAAESPKPVLWARPTQAEASSSFAALDDLFRPVLVLLPRLPLSHRPTAPVRSALSSMSSSAPRRARRGQRRCTSWRS